MNKNVIYTIDCTYNDEWHRKEIAKQKLLKDRGSMTDEHINSIFEWPWFSDDQEIWSKTTKYYLKKYAEKINADLIILNTEHSKRLNLPDCWTNYQRSNLLKFYALKEFEKSNYEKFLCLDLDILVTLGSPSIFDTYGNGFFMYPDNYPRSRINSPKKLKKHFNLDVAFKNPRDLSELKSEAEKEYQFANETLYNGGVILCDKNTAINLCKAIPNNQGWLNFLKNNNLENNPDFGEGDNINDQDFIQLFLRRRKIKAKQIGIEWNSPIDLPPDFRTDLNASRYNFIHLFGDQTDFNPRKLLPFLNQRFSIFWIKNLYHMIMSDELEIPPPRKTLFNRPNKR